MHTQTRTELLDDALLTRASQVCKLLSHPIRLRIIELLMQEEIAVCELAGKIGIPQPSVSHHLGVLRANGIADMERRGQRVIYTVVSSHARAIIDYLQERARED